MKRITIRNFLAGIVAAALLAAGAYGVVAQPGQSPNFGWLRGAALGSSPAWVCQGLDTNVGCNVVTQGTGTLTLNGVPVTGGAGSFTTITASGLVTQNGGEVTIFPGPVSSGITATLKSSPIRIFHSTAQVTTVGTGEETAYTYVLPAGALNNDGQMLRFDVWSLVNAGGGNKQLRVKFGATTISDSTLAGFANNSLLQTTCYLFRTGAATQRSLCVMTDGVNGSLINGASTNTAKNLTSPAETLSGAVTILVTQTTSVAAQLTSEFAAIDFYPQGQ